MILFVIFINDTDVNISRTLSKFADDCNAACAVQCTERAFILQVVHGQDQMSVPPGGGGQNFIIGKLFIPPL